MQTLLSQSPTSAVEVLPLPATPGAPCAVEVPPIGTAP